MIITLDIVMITLDIAIGFAQNSYTFFVFSIPNQRLDMSNKDIKWVFIFKLENLFIFKYMAEV